MENCYRGNLYKNRHLEGFIWRRLEAMGVHRISWPCNWLFHWFVISLREFQEASMHDRDDSFNNEIIRYFSFCWKRYYCCLVLYVSSCPSKLARIIICHWISEEMIQLSVSLCMTKIVLSKSFLLLAILCFVWYFVSHCPFKLFLDLWASSNHLVYLCTWYMNPAAFSISQITHVMGTLCWELSVVCLVLFAVH